MLTATLSDTEVAKQIGIAEAHLDDVPHLVSKEERTHFTTGLGLNRSFIKSQNINVSVKAWSTLATNNGIKNTLQ